MQFQRVLTINKLYPLVHYQLGRAALMMNDPREALNQTDDEKRANPNLPDAYLLAAEAHSLIAAIQHVRDRISKSHQACDRKAR